MRKNNPAKNMTPEWREKIGKSNTGKTRSPEQRMRYRESKLGEKNPNFINGSTAGTRSRIAEVNHKVVSVEKLTARAATYCLDVPATGWFFANNVLVKNCSFCARSERLRDQKEMDQSLYRRLVIEMVEAGVEELGMFYLGESFMCDWMPEAIKYAKDAGIKYVFLTTNGSLATPDAVEACMRAGLDSLKFSINYADTEQFESIARVKGTMFDAMIANIMSSRLVRDRVEAETGHRCGLYGSYIRYDGEQGERMQSLVADLAQHLDEIYALPLYGQGGPQESPLKGSGLVPVGGNTGRAANPVPALPCWAVFTEGHITWDGKLSACCWAHTDALTMADLNKVSFMGGWLNAEFRYLRSAHLAEDVRGTSCEGCIHGGAA